MHCISTMPEIDSKRRECVTSKYPPNGIPFYVADAMNRLKGWIFERIMKDLLSKNVIEGGRSKEEMPKHFFQVKGHDHQAL